MKNRPENNMNVHESAVSHVTGKALYVNDIQLNRMLYGCIVTSPYPSADILSIDTSGARAYPGVLAVLTAADIPGENNMGPVVKDEPCLAQDEVMFRGQAVALVAADSLQAAREAADKVRFEWKEKEAIVTLRQAMQNGGLLSPERRISTGDVEQGLASAPYIIEGELETGAQEHWYLETQSALAIPEEQHIRILASTQHPSETQALVAEVLGLGRNLVQVEALRLGGAFGGKETQASHVACWAALLAKATALPVKVHLHRQQDMSITGKRHPFLSSYRAGYDEDGRLLAVDIDLNSDGGAALDLSAAIMERAMFHVDNAYFVPNLRVRGRIWKTNLPPNTAFRGFGGPQGMAVIETIVDRIARERGKDAALVRKLNFYGLNDRNLTHYGEEVERNLLHRLFDELMESSGYLGRRREIDRFNHGNTWKKRGIALTPVKFGISFTTSFLNQASALVNLYQDGSVVVNHGGVEMGQGLHTKMIAIAAETLGVSRSSIRISPTDTQVTPNTSATAASSGSDLNGMAVQDACIQIRERLERIASERLFTSLPGSPSPGQVHFKEGWVWEEGQAERKVPLKNVIALAYRERINLSARGFYRTPDIHFDKEAGRGHPFHYYAFGMAVSEVEVDLLSGGHELLRVDILHDAGKSIHPQLDLGQVRGAFVQGLGWVTLEEVVWDASGRLLTDSPDTYKIPTFCDIPGDFRVKLLENAPNPVAVKQSKAVGEPPFMLALSVWLAIKDALSAVDGHRLEPPFRLPATYEVILRTSVALQKSR